MNRVNGREQAIASVYPQLPKKNGKEKSVVVANQQLALQKKTMAIQKKMSEHSVVLVPNYPVATVKPKKDLLKPLYDSKPGVLVVQNALWACRAFSLFRLQGKQGKVDSDIDSLSGSTLLSNAIHSIAPLWAKSLRSWLISQDLYKGLHQFFVKEHLSFKTIIEILLSQMYVNIAKNIKEPAEGYPGHAGPVTLTDVIRHLTALVNAHLPRINAAFEPTFKRNTDPEKRKRKLCQLFVPLVEEFLSVALPGGLKQLPFRKMPIVSNFAWNYLHSKLQTELLPKLFLHAYCEMATPLNQEKKELLQSMPGGESLAGLAELASKKMGENIPNIFSTENESDLPDFMQMLAKNFAPLFQGNISTQEELGNWTAKQIVDLGTNGNDDISQLRMFIGSYLDPLLVHVFLHMGSVPETKSSQGRYPDVLGIILIRLFSLLSSFFNKNDKAIEERIAALNPLACPESDSALISFFESLAHDLMELMGLGDPNQYPVPSFLQNILHSNLKSFLPKFLLRQYFAIKGSVIDDEPIHKKLCSLLFDTANLQSKDVAIKVISQLHTKDSTCNMYDEFFRNLWNESGTENIVETIEKLCGVCAHEIVRSTLSRFGIQAQKRLNAPGNVFMHKTRAYFIKHVKSMLLQAIVNVIETTPDFGLQKEGEHPQRMLPMKVILRLGEIFERGLKYITQRLYDAATIAGDDMGMFHQLARKGFLDLASEFYPGEKNLFDNLPVEGLPAADSIKNVLWSSFKEILLPDLLYNLHSEFTSWHRRKQITEKALGKHYRTTHAIWASKVVAQFSSDWLKNYLANYSDDAAKALVQSLIQYFSQVQAVEGKSVKRDMESGFQNVQAFSSDNLRALGETEAEQLQALWPTITLYIESFMVKFLAGLSKTIAEVEAENPDFLVDIAIDMLKDTAAYFEALNKAHEKVDKDAQLPLLTVLGNKVHDGVPLDSKQNQDEKDRIRLQGHFIPLASKLFDLAKISIDDLPMPSGLKEQMGELIMTYVLPKALMQCNSKALEHSMRDTLMLLFVQNLYEALNSIKPTREVMPAETKLPLDPKHKNLIETCGTVVRELANRIPDTMVQYIFMKEKVKNMSAEALGEAMMPYLSKYTLLLLIDKGIYVGLPLFHPSEWQGKKNGQEALIPKEPFNRADGKLDYIEAKKFKFVFKKTQLEIDAEEQRRKEELKATRLLLRDKFTETISEQLKLKTQAGIKTLWLRLQAYFDDLFEKIFGRKGLKVKGFIDMVAHKICFDFIGAILQLIASPFVKVIRYFMEKNYISKRSDDIIESFHSDALEHLLYKWTDSLIDGLLDLQKHKKPRLT